MPKKMTFPKAVPDYSTFVASSYRIDNQKTARKIKKKKLSCLRNKKNTIFAAVMIRGVAQLASALAWGARGRKFESSHPDESNRKTDVTKVTSVFFVNSNWGATSIVKVNVNVNVKVNVTGKQFLASE